MFRFHVVLYHIYYSILFYRLYFFIICCVPVLFLLQSHFSDTIAIIIYTYVYIILYMNIWYVISRILYHVYVYMHIVADGHESIAIGMYMNIYMICVYIYFIYIIYIYIHKYASITISWPWHLCIVCGVAEESIIPTSNRRGPWLWHWVKSTRFQDRMLLFDVGVTLW